MFKVKQQKNTPDLALIFANLFSFRNSAYLCFNVAKYFWSIILISFLLDAYLISTGFFRLEFFTISPYFILLLIITSLLLSSTQLSTKLILNLNKLRNTYNINNKKTHLIFSGVIACLIILELAVKMYGLLEVTIFPIIIIMLLAAHFIFKAIVDLKNRDEKASLSQTKQILEVNSYNFTLVIVSIIFARSAAFLTLANTSQNRLLLSSVNYILAVIAFYCCEPNKYHFIVQCKNCFCTVIKSKNPESLCIKCETLGKPHSQTQTTLKITQ
jgi:hypothetical protein